MPNPTLSALAASILAASGTDCAKPPTRPVLLTMARTLAERGGCHISTARRHMWRAWAKQHSAGGASAKSGAGPSSIAP